MMASLNKNLPNDNRWGLAFDKSSQPSFNNL